MQVTVNLHLRSITNSHCKLLIVIGEDFERENPVFENLPLLATSYSTSQIQQPVREVNDSDHSDDLQLVARARAVGVQYEFAQHGVAETEDDRRKRKR